MSKGGFCFENIDIQADWGRDTCLLCFFLSVYLKKKKKKKNSSLLRNRHQHRHCQRCHCCSFVVELPLLPTFHACQSVKRPPIRCRHCIRLTYYLTPSHSTLDPSTLHNYHRSTWHWLRIVPQKAFWIILFFWKILILCRTLNIGEHVKSRLQKKSISLRTYHRITSGYHDIIQICYSTPFSWPT